MSSYANIPGGIGTKLYTCRAADGKYANGYSPYGGYKNPPNMTNELYAKLWATVAAVKAYMSRAGRTHFTNMGCSMVCFELQELWAIPVDDFDALRKMHVDKREKYLEVMGLKHKIQRIKDDAMNLRHYEAELAKAEDELTML